MTELFKTLLAFLTTLFAKQIQPQPQPVEPVAIETPPPPQSQKPTGLSAQIIAVATGATVARAIEYLVHLEAAMADFDINTPLRKAMFLAQIGHESGGLRYTSEIWGPTPAQRRYEGRADLGNIRPGDGSFFRGRGFIQITGRANHKSISDALGVDFLANPEWLAMPEWAAPSAAWWWKKNGLNELADTGSVERCTRRINGGLNGLADRQARYAKALAVFKTDY